MVAVGGTRLGLRTSGGYFAEEGWEDTLEGSGAGGGIAVRGPRPAWQLGPGVDLPGSAGHRLIPDVSAAADPDSGFYSVWRDTTTASCKGRSAARVPRRPSGPARCSSSARPRPRPASSRRASWRRCSIASPRPIRGVPRRHARREPGLRRRSRLGCRHRPRLAGHGPPAERPARRAALTRAAGPPSDAGALVLGLLLGRRAPTGRAGTGCRS